MTDELCKACGHADSRHVGLASVIHGDRCGCCLGGVAFRDARAAAIRREVTETAQTAVAKLARRLERSRLPLPTRRGPATLIDVLAAHVARGAELAAIVHGFELANRRCECGARLGLYQNERGQGELCPQCDQPLASELRRLDAVRGDECSGQPSCTCVACLARGRG